MKREQKQLPLWKIILERHKFTGRWLRPRVPLVFLRLRAFPEVAPSRKSHVYRESFQPRITQYPLHLHFQLSFPWARSIVQMNSVAKVYSIVMDQRNYLHQRSIVYWESKKIQRALFSSENSTNSASNSYRFVNKPQINHAQTNNKQIDQKHIDHTQIDHTQINHNQVNHALNDSNKINFKQLNHASIGEQMFHQFNSIASLNVANFPTLRVMPQLDRIHELRTNHEFSSERLRPYPVRPYGGFALPNARYVGFPLPNARYAGLALSNTRYAGFALSNTQHQELRHQELRRRELRHSTTTTNQRLYTQSISRTFAAQPQHLDTASAQTPHQPAPPPPRASAPAPQPALDIARLSDEVYRHIQQKIRVDRERRGL